MDWMGVTLQLHLPFSDREENQIAFAHVVTFEVTLGVIFMKQGRLVAVIQVEEASA